MFNKKKNNKGFTLVELLVVIAIIGILAVVAVPSLMKNINKAKAADIVADYSAIKAEVISEYADSSLEAGTYTNTADGKLQVDADTVLDVQDLSGEATYSLVIANTTSGNATAVLTITAQNDDVATRVKDDINGTIADATKNIVTVDILN